jgi:hypothetical protein
MMVDLCEMNPAHATQLRVARKRTQVRIDSAATMQPAAVSARLRDE